jgi:FMN phosphatase YigB (HAD superfamily)
MKAYAIIFDVDGTLYKLKPTGVFRGSYFQQYILRNIRSYLDRSDNAHLHKLLNDYVRYGASLTRFFTENSLPEADYLACWDIEPSGIVESDPGISKTFRDIRAEGAELFLVSRAPAVWIRNVITYSRIERDAFTKIFVREDIPTTKDSAMLEIKSIIHSKGLNEESVYMVGDEEEADLNPARRVGFMAVKSEGPASVKNIVNQILTDG